MKYRILIFLISWFIREGAVCASKPGKIEVLPQADRTRVLFDWCEAAPFYTEKTDKSIGIFFENPCQYNFTDLRKLPSHMTCQPTKDPKGHLGFIFRSNSECFFNTFTEKDKVILDISNKIFKEVSGSESKGDFALSPDNQEASSLAKKPADKKFSKDIVSPTSIPNPTSISNPASAPVLSVDSSPPAQVMVKSKKIENFYVLNFEWTVPTGAVAFVRGDFVWVMFDHIASFDVTRIEERTPELSDQINWFKTDTGTAFRFRLETPMWPKIEKNNNAWILTLYPYPIEEEPTGMLLTQNDQTIEIRCNDPCQLAKVEDPDIGDIMWVIFNTTLAAVKAREYPTFLLLTTLQGAVIKPLVDDLNINKTTEGYKISRSSGLLLSPQNTSLASLEPTAFLDFKKWLIPVKNPLKKGRELLEAIAMTKDPLEMYRRRLELVNFYLAHNFAREALGVLKQIEEASSDFDDDAICMVYRGIAYFMTKEYEKAIRDLSIPLFKDEPEPKLWREAAAAARDEVSRNREFSTHASFFLEIYPTAMRFKLGIIAARSAIDYGDVLTAETILSLLEKTSPDRLQEEKLTLLRGLLAEKKGSPKIAEQYWQKVIDGGSQKSYAQARFYKIRMQRDQGFITTKQAIAELEKLRFAWRQDPFEARLLAYLSDLYVESKKYENGLAHLERIIKEFPETSHAEKARLSLQKIFKILFEDNGVADLSATKGVTIFQQYKPLLPPGFVTSKMSLTYSERLAKLDLLSQASRELQKQLEKGFSIPTALRLAEIQLENQNLEEALKTLSLIPADTLKGEELKRFRLTKAETLGDQGKIDEAYQVLESDISPEAFLLTAQLAFTQKNWAKVADSLLQLRTNSSTFNSTLILNEAVSRYLANDLEKLPQLRTDFLAKMGGTTEQSAFEIVTQPDIDPKSPLIAQAITQVTDVNNFQSFLKSYQKKQ